MDNFQEPTKKAKSKREPGWFDKLRYDERLMDEGTSGARSNASFALQEYAIDLMFGGFLGSPGTKVDELSLWERFWQHRDWPLVPAPFLGAGETSAKLFSGKGLDRNRSGGPLTAAALKTDDERKNEEYESARSTLQAVIRGLAARGLLANHCIPIPEHQDVISILSVRDTLDKLVALHLMLLPQSKLCEHLRTAAAIIRAQKTCLRAYQEAIGQTKFQAADDEFVFYLTRLRRRFMREDVRMHVQLAQGVHLGFMEDAIASAHMRADFFYFGLADRRDESQFEKVLRSAGDRMREAAHEHVGILVSLVEMKGIDPAKEQIDLPQEDQEKGRARLQKLKGKYRDFVCPDGCTPESLNRVLQTVRSHLSGTLDHWGRAAVEAKARKVQAFKESEFPTLALAASPSLARESAKARPKKR